jgi:hypothetical protein
VASPAQRLLADYAQLSVEPDTLWLRKDLISTTSPPPSASRKQLLPWLVAVAFFMESLDTTILNTAVLVMANALDVAPLSMKSVLASYTLSLAVFIPISGWMVDRFGTRRVFASAIGLFTLGALKKMPPKKRSGTVSIKSVAVTGTFWPPLVPRLVPRLSSRPDRCAKNLAAYRI